MRSDCCSDVEPIKEKLKTITTDNGMEFSAHEVISKALGVEVFFTDPYSSWQKGAIENANGLIRQYIPKRASFDEYDDKDIQRIKDKINRRPRKNSISFPLRVLCQKLPLNLHSLLEFAWFGETEASAKLKGDICMAPFNLIRLRSSLFQQSFHSGNVFLDFSEFH